MPEPVSYTRVGTPTHKKVTEFTTIRGVRVERVLEAGIRSIDSIRYATDDKTLMKPIVVKIVKQLLVPRSIPLWTLIR